MFLFFFFPPPVLNHAFRRKPYVKSAKTISIGVRLLINYRNRTAMVIIKWVLIGVLTVVGNRAAESSNAARPGRQGYGTVMARFRPAVSVRGVNVSRIRRDNVKTALSCDGTR